MTHVIVDKSKNCLYFEGIDKADCLMAMKPSFMKHLNSGKPITEFNLVYKELSDIELDKLASPRF